jgi:hypothetical protein
MSACYNPVYWACLLPACGALKRICIFIFTVHKLHSDLQHKTGSTIHLKLLFLHTITLQTTTTTTTQNETTVTSNGEQYTQFTG